MIYGRKTHDGLVKPLAPAALFPVGTHRTKTQPDGSVAPFVCVLVVIEHPPVPPHEVRPRSLADEGRWFATTKRWIGVDWLRSLDREAEFSARSDERLIGEGPWNLRSVTKALRADPDSVLSPLYHMPGASTRAQTGKA